MSRNDRAARRARHGAHTGEMRFLRITAAVTAGVVGFGLVFSGTYWERATHALTTQDNSSLITAPTGFADDPSTLAASPTASADDSPADANAGNDINILLIGSDVRDGTNAKIGGKVPGMRSDTSMIMHISADRSRIDFLSIPRDSRVRISDCKLFNGKTKKGWTAKFNTAFANGGVNGNAAEAAACEIQTIQDLTGIIIDHYAVIDFIGFENMINAVGGVPMCIEKKVSSKKAQLHLKAGAQVLDGKTALAWARARTGTGLGDGTDLMRIDRQHEMLSNLSRKALGLNMLTDVGTVTLLVKSMASAMTVDPDLGSLPYLLGLGYSLRNIDSNNINFATVPWKYPGDHKGDIVWTSEAKSVFKRIRNDTPMEGADSTSTSPSADPSVDPTVLATPERETQDQILADCTVG